MTQSENSSTRESLDALRQLNERNYFLDSILNSLHDGIIVIDADARIIYINRVAESMFGISRGEISGMLYQSVFGANLSERFSPLVTLKYGESLHYQEKDITTASDRDPISVRFSTLPLFDAAGNRCGAVEVLTDLSRLKQMENALQQMKTQASMAQMAGLIAHEIRNPLGGIVGNVDVLMQQVSAKEDVNNVLKEIKTAVDQIDDVVSRFQWYAKPVKPQTQHVNLNEYFPEVISVFKNRTHFDSDKIQLIYQNSLEGKSPEWPLDPVLMEHVILAILDNGAKAIKDSGSIRISMDTCDEGTQKEMLEISITDTGEGMSPEVMDRLFTPFFTTRARGAGLGLAVARNIVQLHRGKISVQSAPGKGATFKVQLPK